MENNIGYLPSDSGRLLRKTFDERVRDLGQFQSVRSNQLTGYGVVVGLDGSGDDNFAYVTQAMRGVSGRLGLQLPPGVNPALKNAAAVIITAELPAFAKPGQRIDVTVSTMGKAKSLRGGALVMTPLYGADGQIYAMAQGNLAVGGLGVSGQDGSKLTVIVPTVGRIADGATVEQAVASNFDFTEVLRWNLYQADFLTISRVRDAINAVYPGMAQVEDGVTLALMLPPGANTRAQIMADIEMLDINPAERAAKVVINSRTGTIVVGQNVKVSPAAVTHGNLTVTIEENPEANQPNPFTDGETVIEPNTQIAITEDPARMFQFGPAVTLNEIVQAVNQVGAAPGDVMAVLEALKQAGALRAELIVI